MKNFLFLSLAILITMTSCMKDCDDTSMGKETSCSENQTEIQGDWDGEFNQYNFTKYQMVMVIEESEECNFYGQLQWPSLNNSITSMEGYFQNDSVFFTETSILQGSNIVLNGNYKATFSGDDEISGTWDYPNGGSEGGSFIIRKN